MTEDVQQIVTDYEHRWVIEDHHKGVKTGGTMEERQYMTGARLERVLGVLSVAENPAGKRCGAASKNSNNGPRSRSAQRKLWVVIRLEAHATNSRTCSPTIS